MQRFVIKNYHTGLIASGRSDLLFILFERNPTNYITFRTEKVAAEIINSCFLDDRQRQLIIVPVNVKDKPLKMLNKSNPSNKHNILMHEVNAVIF